MRAWAWPGAGDPPTGNLKASPTTSNYSDGPISVAKDSVTYFDITVQDRDTSGGQSVYDTVNWYLDFGDGWTPSTGSGNQTDIAHTYTSSGVMTARLRVNDQNLYYTDIASTSATPPNGVEKDTVTVKVFEVAMTPSGDTKVMISTKWDDDYPSPAQTEDGKIKVTATVTCGGQPLSGVTLYFDVIDPDDESSYETDTLAGDNHPQPGGDTGSLSQSSDTSDANGEADTVLTITNQYAGNNYIVRARWPDAAGQVVAQSGLLIAWKRIYVEEDKMYRSGSDLSADFAADGNSDPDIISVVSAAGFAVNDTIIVFDADHPTGETATVSAKSGNDLTLNIDLQNSYDAGYPRTNGRGAAVVKQGTAVHDPDVVSRVWDAFSGAADGSDGGCFVGVKILDDGGTNVPYQPSLQDFSNPAAFEYSDVWCDNANRSNYIHLIGAYSYTSEQDHYYGMTWIDEPSQQDPHDLICIYVSTIYYDYPATGAIVNADSTSHELGHLVAQTQVDGNHPNVWCHEGAGTDLCLMDADRDREDEDSEFCHDAPNHIDEWRDAVDDLPLP